MIRKIIISILVLSLCIIPFFNTKKVNAQNNELVQGVHYVEIDILDYFDFIIEYYNVADAYYGLFGDVDFFEIGYNGVFMNNEWVDYSVICSSDVIDWSFDVMSYYNQEILRNKFPDFDYANSFGVYNIGRKVPIGFWPRNSWYNHGGYSYEFVFPNLLNSNIGLNFFSYLAPQGHTEGNPAYTNILFGFLDNAAIYYYFDSEEIEQFNFYFKQFLVDNPIKFVIPSVDILNNISLEKFFYSYLFSNVSIDFDNYYLDNLKDRYFESGRQAGYIEGATDNSLYDSGKSEGYNQGYADGLRDADDITAHDFYNLQLNFIFDSISTFLSIEILPNFYLGYVIGIPLLFGLISFIFKGRL